jgi:hypothetical protein
LSILEAHQEPASLSEQYKSLQWFSGAEQDQQAELTYKGLQYSTEETKENVT